MKTNVVFKLNNKTPRMQNKKSNETKNNKKIQQKTKIRKDVDETEFREKYNNINTDEIKSFLDLPLTPQTLKGLKDSEYTKPTEIQRETLKLAFLGKDILGAAQTGSGKTLAFIIPILELLHRKQWTKLDGIGALVITPTRELAYQIFETLRKVGRHHDFSAGLIIGGKDLKFERNRMDQCNIIICTPGRLLQHMDQNPLFDCVNMQILVLDEADRCLDMGFETTMNAIIANLPPKRQTLLFSATQTKSVKDLARLSLKDPSYISVHEHLESSTPSGLQQSYVVCELKDKVSILWSFIKNHIKQKTIIFFSSCKQVKYIYEIFCKLRPGLSILALYGTLHQLRRMDIYDSFCRKSNAVLFATDLAARGLDFPEVDWVVQADCPEDAATYIHRVGRTARYHRGGESLLLLLPSELAMVDQLTEKKIPIEKIEINSMRMSNPVKKMEAFLAKDPTLKDTAQRAFVSYAKAVFLMKNKEVFNVHSLDVESFAHSLGLAIAPRIRFLQRMNKKVVKATPLNKKIVFNDDEDENADSPEENVSNEDENEDNVETPVDTPFHVSSDDSDSDDGMLKVKRKDHDIDLPDNFELEQNVNLSKSKKPITKAALAKKMLKKKIVPNKKIVFDDEGGVISSNTKEKRSELAQQYENEEEGGIDIEKAKIILREEDKYDKQLFKEKVKAKHKEEKRKLKAKKLQEEEEDEFSDDKSDYEPDLSWLPDPDKIYGKQDEEDNEMNQTDDEKAEVVQEKPKMKKKSKKREREDSEIQPKKKKKKDLRELSKDMNVKETEELAMLLLRQ